MKEKNKKVILFGIIIVAIALIAVILYLILGKDDKLKTLGGSEQIVTTLIGSSQEEIDEKIKSELENGEYNLQNAKIYIDPYGRSKLSALIVFKTDKKTDVTVTIKGKNDDDVVLKYGDATNHYIPIFGLYQNHTNEIEVRLGSGESKTFSIDIEDLNYDLDVIVNSAEYSLLNNDIYFITSPIAMSSFAIDSHGEIRWITNEHYFHEIVLLDNGHLLIGTDETNEKGLNTKLLEIDYLGRIYKEYDIPEGYLNNFVVKEDGNIILASQNAERETFSEYIIEIDSETGKIVKTWDLFEMLSSIDSSFTSNIDRDDYFYNSGIEYYEETDSLLLTYWGGEFVVNVSYKEDFIKWIFSDPSNFTSSFDSFLLDAPDDFVYPKSMHSASLNGKTLKVFNNGYSTNANNPNSSNLIGSYSSAQTFELDGNSISLTNTYDENKRLFSYALGDYEIVSNDNELLLFGRELRDLDYTKGVDINEYSDTFTRLIEKNSGKTVLDLEINWATHMIKKIDLDGEYIFDFVSPSALTTLVPTEKEELTSDIITTAKNTEFTIDYRFGYSNTMIEHNVLFMSIDEAKLVLINDNEQGAVYTLKVKGEVGSKRIVTDLAKGKYYVYVFENGIMYKTDSFVEIN